MSERVTAAERRGQIIQAAVDLFSRRGFRGTTTRQIAQAVGISEAALFRYFATKEALYSAIIEAKSQTEAVIAKAAAAAGRRDDLEGHELSELFFRSRVRRLHEYLANSIRAQAAAGRFRPVDPLLAARAFLGMVFHNLLIHELFGMKREAGQRVEDVVEGFVARFLRGLETDGRPGRSR